MVYSTPQDDFDERGTPAPRQLVTPEETRGDAKARAGAAARGDAIKAQAIAEDETAPGPRVGAPAGFDLGAQLQRSTILAAAGQVFAHKGVTTARVEDILLEADIARRTFYRYFASKEDVLAALYEVWTGELLKAIEGARRAAPQDPLAGIRAGLDIFLAFFRGATPRPGGEVPRKGRVVRAEEPRTPGRGIARAVRELVELAMRSDSLLAERRRWARGEIVRILDDSVYALDRRRLDPLVFYGLLGALEGIALEIDGSNLAEIERARRVLHGFVDQILGLSKRKTK